MAGAVPLQIIVDPKDPDRGFYSVRAFVSERGAPGVAVAAQASYGVYLSTAGGRQGSFTHVGLANVDTRTLAVQYDGPATVLWAAPASRTRRSPARAATAPGCSRPTCAGRTLSGRLDRRHLLGPGFARPPRWRPARAAGCCGSTRRPRSRSGSPPSVNCGLPLRDRTRFVAGRRHRRERPTRRRGRRAGAAERLILAGGERGVHRSADAVDWTASANQATADVVTIPHTWLLVLRRARHRGGAPRMRRDDDRPAAARRLPAGLRARQRAVGAAGRDGGAARRRTRRPRRRSRTCSTRTGPGRGWSPFLARWVAMDHLVASPRPDAPLPLPVGRLRDLVANAALLARWRGTPYGMRRALELATGLPGFAIDEPTSSPSTSWCGCRRPPPASSP